MDNLSKVVDLIQKLRVRTVERGATASEAETAAVKIGRLLMQHPELGFSILSGKGQMEAEARRSAQERYREQRETVLRQSEQMASFLRQRAEPWPRYEMKTTGGFFYNSRSDRKMGKQ